MRPLFRVALLSALLAAGCARSPRSPVVARVGDAVLTLDDLRRSLPPEYRGRISREQNINYVKEWIDTELLYQEALKRKLQREPAMRQRLESMRRELLSAELLSRQQAAGKQLQVSDSMVQQYYQANRETFVRPRDVVRCLQIVLDSYQAAAAVRSQATAENFLVLAAQYSKQPLDDPRSVPCVPLEDLPGPVAAAVAGLRMGGTTPPVKMGERYCVVHLLERQPAGSVASFDEVRERILDRLTAQQQKEDVDGLLSSLRMKTEVSFNFDAIAPDAAPRGDSALGGAR